jgi:hypothetical protein
MLRRGAENHFEWSNHMRTVARFSVMVCLAMVLGGGACPNATVNIELDQAVENIDRSVTTIQETDVTTIDVPEAAVERDDVVVVEETAIVITNVREDFIVRPVEDFLVLGFDNQTGRDIFVDYEVDGDFQSVFVFDNETVLIEYNCILEVHLLGEDDYDPFTDEFIESFDLADFFYFEGEDYDCGDLLVLTIDPRGVAPDASPVPIFDN